MPYPYSIGNSITTASFNDLYDIVNEVLGVGEDGYGLQDFVSTPVTGNFKITAGQWIDLRRDLVLTAYQHITSSTNVLLTPINTGTTVIGVAHHNEAKTIADYVLANRFTCAEGQYYRDPTTGATVNYTGGTTTRTLEWGVGTDVEIVHVAKARWPTRLLARYFFNTGGYYTWTPYHSNNGLNDLDAEWAEFIRSIQVAQATNPIKYDRAAFVAQSPGTTTTIYPVGSSGSGLDPTYESGTLSILVRVFKASDEESIEFTITFANSNSADLVIVPSVGYWNETI
jgi:hypothetical protein